MLAGERRHDTEPQRARLHRRAIILALRQPPHRNVCSSGVELVLVCTDPVRHRPVLPPPRPRAQPAAGPRRSRRCSLLLNASAASALHQRSRISASIRMSWAVSLSGCQPRLHALRLASASSRAAGPTCRRHRHTGPRPPHHEPDLEVVVHAGARQPGSVAEHLDHHDVEAVVIGLVQLAHVGAHDRVRRQQRPVPWSAG